MKNVMIKNTQFNINNNAKNKALETLNLGIILYNIRFLYILIIVNT